MTDMSVAGDEDQWMLLERASSAGLPLVVLSRINPSIETFAAANLITAVICDVDPKLVRDDGMPTCMDSLYAHEDKLVALVAETGETAYHTASVTGDGRRTIYLAHSGDARFRSVLSELHCGVATVSVFTAFEFETYSNFVTPTALDKQLDGDQRVIATLQEQGDDGSRPRKIDFWFYGVQPSLEQLVQRLATRGFVVDHWIDEPVGAVLSLDAPADVASFRNLTPVLIEAADEAGVEYDGWETFVVRENPPPRAARPPSFFGRMFGQKKH